MEQIIAKLLQDFEQGRLSRRQLIQEGCHLYFGPTVGATHISLRKGTGTTPRFRQLAIEIENWDTNVINAELKCRQIPMTDLNGDDPHLTDPEGFIVRVAPKGGGLHEQPNQGSPHIGPGSGVHSAAVAAPPGPGLKVIRLNHISIDVNDYTKSRDFYAGLFGMRVANDNGESCRLYFGPTVGAEHISLRKIIGKAPRPLHLAFEIENWDTKMIEAVMKRRGIEVTYPTSSGDPRIYDPEGFPIQISKNGGSPHEQPNEGGVHSGPGSGVHPK